MSPRDRLLTICVQKLEAKGLLDKKYQNRLTKEVKEVDNQQEYEYFLEAYDKKLQFEKNENNLLIPYLLDLTFDFDIDKDPIFFYGDFPDCDTDFLPEVQQYLKTEWAPKTFGPECVCSVGNYTTFGIKSALIDSARVHGKDRIEILALTTKMGLKDDEGKDLTWDKALELFPELKDYCDRNPDVAEFAKRLVHRTRGMGTHAAGLIISKSPIDELVPIVLGKDGEWVSAFVEGLHGQDLGPLGLIKFDCLVVMDLLRIATIAKLIRERHGVKTICAKPNQDDWSDTSYLNDPKSIEMANKSDLIGIFQFDSPGIRELCRKGGVDKFEDMVAYNSIYRPSCLQVGMDKAYVHRKKGEEEYTIHPVMNYLKDTYGIMVYQEQVMRTLNAVGRIPLPYCEIARKSISKKDDKKIAKMKPDFIENGIKILSWKQDEVEELFKLVQAYSGYGFNLSHATSYCYISMRLLYLKVYYPLEFFAGTLMCESNADKIKQYKTEAEKYNIKINRVSVNKSDWNFKIADNEIFMGFSNIKGIGEKVAQEIVAGQPYSSFIDFLNRFGTDANIVKPLIGLNCFDDADRATLYEFYEHYKIKMKRREDRDKRSVISIEKYMNEFIEMIPKEKEEWALELVQSKVTKEEFQQVWVNKNTWEDAWKLYRKFNKSKEEIIRKKSEDQSLSIEKFTVTGNIDPELAKIYADVQQIAEAKYYGFGWDHLIEYSPDYEGDMTFERFNDDTKVTLCVECQIIKKPEKKVSKNGKTTYYTILVEDANCNQQMVTIWEEDYKRFKEEFEYWNGDRRGNFLKIRLERPSHGFKNYTFESWSKQIRAKYMPKEKSQDHRLEVMRTPEVGDMCLNSKV